MSAFPAPTMRLTVVFDGPGGGVFPLEVSGGTSLEVLRALIHAELQVPPEQQQLVVRGQIIPGGAEQDQQTLEALRIQDNDMVQVRRQMLPQQQQQRPNQVGPAGPQAPSQPPQGQGNPPNHPSAHPGAPGSPGGSGGPAGGRNHAVEQELRLADLPPELLRDPASFQQVVRASPPLLQELFGVDPELAQAVMAADGPDLVLQVLQSPFFVYLSLFWGEFC